MMLTQCLNSLDEVLNTLEEEQTILFVVMNETLMKPATHKLTEKTIVESVNSEVKIDQFSERVFHTSITDILQSDIIPDALNFL